MRTREPASRLQDGTVLARGPRGHRRGVRDGDQRCAHQKGEERGAGCGHEPHERQPGVEDVLVAGRVARRPSGARPSDVIYPYPDTSWRRRVVHLMRSAAGNAPTGQKKGAVPGVLKAVLAERDPELARGLYRLATAEIEGFRPKAAEAPEEAEAGALTHLVFPAGTTSGRAPTTCGGAPAASSGAVAASCRSSPAGSRPSGRRAPCSRRWPGTGRAADGSATALSAEPSRAPRSTGPRAPAGAPRPSTRPGSSRPRWPTTRFPAGSRRSMRQNDGVPGDSRLLVQPAATLENRALDQLSGRHPRRTDPHVPVCPHAALSL